MNFTTISNRIAALGILLLVITPIMAPVITDMSQQSNAFLMDAGVLLALTVNVGGLFYFGGKIKAAIESHEKRITQLEETGSQHAAKAEMLSLQVAESLRELRQRVDAHFDKDGNS